MPGGEHAKGNGRSWGRRPSFVLIQYDTARAEDFYQSTHFLYLPGQESVLRSNLIARLCEKVGPKGPASSLNCPYSKELMIKLLTSGQDYLTGRYLFRFDFELAFQESSS